jgi:hypothetical protein
VIQALRSRLGQPEFEKNIALRANRVIQKSSGVEDCDFVSQEAFVAAYQARKSYRGALGKPGLLTVIDRSLPVGARRVMTVDLNSGKILYHSAAAFGDADGNSATVGMRESSSCSNRSETNASPVGGAIAGITRPGRAFSGLGTFLTTMNGRQDRSIAFHSFINGRDMFSGYESLYEEHDRPGDRLQTLLREPTSRNVDLFLWKTLASKVEPGATNGCVGLPADGLEQFQSLVDGGSYVYFHCSPSQTL